MIPFLRAYILKLILTLHLVELVAHLCPLQVWIIYSRPLTILPWLARLPLYAIFFTWLTLPAFNTALTASWNASFSLSAEYSRSARLSFVVTLNLSLGSERRGAALRQQRCLCFRLNWLDDLRQRFFVLHLMVWLSWWSLVRLPVELGASVDLWWRFDQDWFSFGYRLSLKPLVLPFNVLVLHV